MVGRWDGEEGWEQWGGYGSYGKEVGWGRGVGAVGGGYGSCGREVRWGRGMGAVGGGGAGRRRWELGWEQSGGERSIGRSWDGSSWRE